MRRLLLSTTWPIYVGLAAIAVWHWSHYLALALASVYLATIGAQTVQMVQAYRRLRESRRPKRHDPTDGCQAIHCYSCSVDEPGHGAYIVCGECGHVYPTARSLRKAYRRAVWEMMRSPYGGRGRWFTDDFAVGYFRQTWAMLTIRASKIAFCQLCVHDF